ncbi:MAG: conserved phage C-terminal domain-containing protein [Erysipelotrichaceae bacterium]|nr:conserved phage C-terminal domain-containing protein [Erysipelotrichaceae bacterium]
MAVLRTHKSENYTTINNEYLRNTELSLKAKGLLTLMLSLPDNWSYSINGLAAICKEKTSAIESAVDELKQFNHLVVEKEYAKKGSSRITYIYHIYEVPCHDLNQKNNNKSLGGDFLGVESQGVEVLGVEVLGVENRPQLNKDIQSKDIQNKEIYLNNVVQEVIEYLNQKRNVNYSPKTKETIKAISKLIATGRTVEQMKFVIDAKIKDWEGTSFEKYLVPNTLFREANFEKYLNEAIKKGVKRDEKYSGVSF